MQFKLALLVGGIRPNCSYNLSSRLPTMQTSLAFFIDRLLTISPESLEVIRKTSREIENRLRTLYAQDKSNPLLDDPMVGIIDLFAAPAQLRTIHSRRIDPSNSEDISKHHVLALSKSVRRKDGEAATISNFVSFQRNWDIFTEFIIDPSFDWDNVIVAGGSVAACILPLPTTIVGDIPMTRRFHQKTSPTSDIDFFVWGLSIPEVRAPSFPLLCQLYILRLP